MTRYRGLPSGHPALLHPGALAPAVVLFAILVAHSVLETARDALFLGELGPHHLASAYIVMAAAALLAVGAVRRWGRMRDPRGVLIASLLLAAGGTAVLAATVTLAPFVVFGFYVWTGFIVTLVVPSFWTAIDRSVRIVEAKRVFGVIGAGGVLGAIAGSALASALGRVVAAHHLVTVGALGFGVATIAAVALVPRTNAAEPPARPRRIEALSRKSRRYVRLLLAVGLVSTVVLTLGDLTFKRVIAERLPAADLATVFGAIYTGLNVIGLVIQLVVTPRLLSRWGVGAALTLLPLILVTTALGFAMTGATIAVIALKLGDGGLRHSLHRVGSEILYLPIPSAIRDGWKLVADAIGQRGGQALAALLVFALAAVGAGARVVAAFTAIAGVAWLVMIAITRRAYIAQFRNTLQAGEIQRDVAIPDLDADSIELLTEALSSPDEVEALAALDLLARRARVPALVFYHPCSAVVRHALSLLGGDLPPDVVRVLGHLLGHPDPKIRAAALAASTRTRFDRALLVSALSDHDPEVRAAALVGLDGDAESAAVADEGIAALLAGTTADRLALANAIAFTTNDRIRPVLHELIARREPSVVRVVLHVLARTPALADVEQLLALLEDPRVRSDVRDVFVAVGNRGLERLIAALDDPQTPLGVRRHLPRTISRFRTPAAAAALVSRLLHDGDSRTEFKILRALGRMRFTDPHLAIDPAPVRDYIRHAVADTARYATLADQFAGDFDAATPGASLIHELLVEKRRLGLERVFRGIGILYPRAGLHSVHDALLYGDEARRSAAREIIEAIAPADIRTALLVLTDDVPPDHRRERLGALAVGPFATYEAFVAALLEDPSESLRCIVAYHVAERRLVALRDELTRLRPTVDAPLVGHAFDQAIARLDA